MIRPLSAVHVAPPLNDSTVASITKAVKRAYYLTERRARRRNYGPPGAITESVDNLVIIR
jgi:hypothetical protein